MRLPLNLTNSATNFDLSTFGTPVVTVASENLFVGTPDILIDIHLSNELQDQLVNVLESLDDAADSLSRTSALNTEIPGVGRTLNELLDQPGSDVKRAWGDFLKFGQTAAEYFDTFDPSSTSFIADNSGLMPSIVGLRNAIAAKISMGTESGLSGRGIKSPLSLFGGIDLTNNELRFDVALAADASTDVDLSFDALGS